MQAEQQIRFGSYQMAPQTGQLWRGIQEVRLTGKASAMLHLFSQDSSLALIPSLIAKGFL
jgi:DNA-binding response OmpR family regulator